MKIYYFNQYKLKINHFILKMNYKKVLGHSEFDI